MKQGIVYSPEKSGQIWPFLEPIIIIKLMFNRHSMYMIDENHTLGASYNALMYRKHNNM